MSVKNAVAEETAAEEGVYRHRYRLAIIGDSKKLCMGEAVHWNTSSPMTLEF